MYRQDKMYPSFAKLALCLISAFFLALFSFLSFAFASSVQELNNSSHHSGGESSATANSIRDSVIGSDVLLGNGVSCTITDIEEVDISGLKSQDAMSLFSESSSKLRLKDSNEIKWIDRVAFPEEFDNTFENFYALLADSCDNDGQSDFLVEDRYVDPSLGARSVMGKFENFENNYTGLEIGVFDYADDADLKSKSELFNDCARAAIAAFDRDNPEVFWLGTTTLILTSTSHRPNASGNFTAFSYLIIGGFQNIGSYSTNDIRSISFTSERSIKTAIQQREERVQELMAKVGIDYAEHGAAINSRVPVEDVLYSDFDKIRFFNRWLTHSNSYNSSSLSTLMSRCPLSYECLSALAGRTGEVGPVCEAYARAFKVLCDAAGISCVLTDGGTSTGAHMWNYAEVDGRWYAVDVTWNDPGSSSSAVSGNENEEYLLVGSSSRPGKNPAALTFNESHIAQNSHFQGGLEFLNGPVLEENAYVVDLVNDIVPGVDSSAYNEIDLSYLEKDLRCAQISYIPDAVYTSAAIKPVPSSVTIAGKTLVQGRDYRLAYENNILPGLATVKVIGIGEFTGQKTQYFNINKAAVGIAFVRVGDVVYTGKQLRPNPVIQLTNPALRRGTDYTCDLTYSNNTNAGIATLSVVVKGIGNYDGISRYTVNFKISPKKATIKKLTAKKRAFVVKWTKATSAWGTGYQLRYSTNSKFKSGVKTATVKKVSTSQLTVKKLKSKKRYYVSMRVYKTVGGVKYYGAWGTTKNIRVK